MLEGGGVVVRLRGLPTKCTAEEVVRFLGSPGLPTDAVHLRCQPRRTTGEAYVVFSSLGEAQNACSKDKDIFCPKSGDRYVRVSIEQDVSPADLLATSSAASGKVPHAKRAAHKPESVVKVSGLPRTITPPEVLSLFWGWQVRPASTYILAPADGVPHAEALVDFEVPEHAALAVAQRHGTTITTAAGRFLLSVRHASKAEWDAAVAAQQGHDAILCVKGLPTHTGQLEVAAFFQGYQVKPGGVHVQPASENKRSKMAMVEFESAAEANRALHEKDRQQFGGTDRFCLLQLASRAELEQELARFQQQQQQQQQTAQAASGGWGGGSSAAPSGIGTRSGSDPGMSMPGSTAGRPNSSMAGGAAAPAGVSSAANMLPHTAPAAAGFPHQQPLPLPLPPMPGHGMHGMMPSGYMLPPGLPPMPGGWPLAPMPMGHMPMAPMPPHLPFFLGGIPSFGFGQGQAPHPGAMQAAASVAASMGAAPGAGGMQPGGPMGMQPGGPMGVPPFQAPNTAAARYMVQDLTTGQRVFLDPRFNLSSFGALPPAYASSAAATAGGTAGGTATGPARGSQQARSELEATATSGGPQEQLPAGNAEPAGETADGSGEGSGQGPSGSGAAEAGMCAGGYGNGHSSGNGHSVAAAGQANGVSTHGLLAGAAADGSSNALLGSSGQSEQTPAGGAHGNGQRHRNHHHHHHHHSHHPRHPHPRHPHKPSSSADEGRANGGSGGGSNDGSDNGSGGDESAAVKRQRMGADSSSGEGSGAAPPGEGGATAMLTTDSIGDARMGGTAGPAQAAPAQPQGQQQPQPPPPQPQQAQQPQQQQAQQAQHVPKDPMKLHSRPSTGDLQEEGDAPPAVKRNRNP